MPPTTLAERLAAALSPETKAACAHSDGSCCDACAVAAAASVEVAEQTGTPLTERQRDALVARLGVEGLTVEEVAEALATPPDPVPEPQGALETFAKAKPVPEPETPLAEEIVIDPENPGRFRAVLLVEEERTADSRMIAKDATTWRSPPLPFMLMRTSNHGGDAGPSVICGVIEAIYREGLQVIAEGRFDKSDEGVEAARLAANKILTGVSVDGGDVDEDFIVEAENAEGLPTKVLKKMSAISVLGATMVPFQAIESGHIEWLAPSGDGLAASGQVFGLPVAPVRTRWDEPAAIARIHEWAATQPDTDDGPNAADLAFLYVDETGRYMPVADVIDGVLTAVPAALRAAARTLGSDAPQVPVMAVDEARTKVARYYGRLATELGDSRWIVPWAADSELALVAAAVHQFDPALFTDPGFEGLVALTVDPDTRRVYGHLAPWGECHTGIDGTCVVAPKSRTGYAHFLTGAAHLTDGTSIPVGRITLGTKHPGLNLSAEDTMRHYDHTGTAVAFVNCGEDEHGIWVSGCLLPNVDEHRAAELAACGGLSGDWRPVGGRRELIAALAVNVPGFPVARVRNGEPMALVAAGYHRDQPSHDAIEAESRAEVRVLTARLDTVVEELGRFRAAIAPVVKERAQRILAASARDHRARLAVRLATDEKAGPHEYDPIGKDGSPCKTCGKGADDSRHGGGEKASYATDEKAGPHEYAPIGDDGSPCKTCGKGADDPRHGGEKESMTAQFATDEDAGPHEYAPIGDDGSPCKTCGKGADDPRHTKVEEEATTAAGGSLDFP